MTPLINLSPLGGGVFLGWSLGANDAANVFGTAVSANVISFRKATILCCLAVILGALLEGQAGITTYRELTTRDALTIAVITSSTAALTVTIMTLCRLPISTSQAIVGAITGIGLVTGAMNWQGLQKIVICWIATPIGAMALACIVYKLLSLAINRIPMSMLTRDTILWTGLIVVGIYGSYALGANNVANATGVFSGAIEGLNDSHLALIGGIAISLGVLTYSKRVMLAVGSGLMPLDAFTALVAVAAMAGTVHIFAVIGVPVSTSQGIVGAIIGISFMRAGARVRFRTLRNISLGWLLTPVVSLILAAAAYAIYQGISSPAT